MSHQIHGLLGVALAIGLLSGCAGSRPNTHSLPLAGKTYVVTGASSGFGKGVALDLGAKGANVVLAARRTKLLEDVAREIRRSGGTSLVVTTDVAKQTDIRNLARASVARYGKIDVWINNAGVGAIGPFWDIPEDVHSRLIDINLKGVVYGSLAAVKEFRKQGYGSLVNVGSIDSEVPLAYQSSYSATKAGVLSLGRALNEEIRLAGQKKIFVSTVMPWAADTPWWPHAANYSGHTARMAGMDDPQKIVDAIVWVSTHPREELPVGWKAKASYVSHRIAPDLTERLSADIAHRQVMKGDSVPPTKGTLFNPMKSGDRADGGVRAQMLREDRTP